MSDFFPLKLFQELLLLWYQKHGRALQWRETLTRINASNRAHGSLRNPYFILVSEIMLQQTLVSTVIPKYNAFLSKWPTIQDLASASLNEVLIAWKGLGYNRRAKHLLETAKRIVHDYGGEFPSDSKILRAFPGFGSYMVSAIRVFAFGQQEAVIDVNVSRVLSRVQIGLQSLPRKELEELAELSVPASKADDWHQALMDFGATVCSAKSPRCAQCPVSRICKANLQAKDLGFETYEQWLITQPKIKKESGKDRGMRFEETDRYFRGRIIDYLREGAQSMEALQVHIVKTHKLGDKKRFGAIIERLVIDGLILIKETQVMLAA